MIDPTAGELETSDRTTEAAIEAIIPDTGAGPEMLRGHSYGAYLYRG